MNQKIVESLVRICTYSGKQKGLYRHEILLTYCCNVMLLRHIFNIHPFYVLLVCALLSLAV